MNTTANDTLPRAGQAQSLSLIAFPTKIGWIGLLHHGYELVRIKIGLNQQRDVFKEFLEYEIGPKRPDDVERQWIEIFQEYSAGQLISFNEFSIQTDGMTPFQKCVVKRCRKIPYGETLSYGELAARAGAPKAARAVGTVMRKNRFPLVVPCHRVVASNGLGGFSGPSGTELKRKLLSLEGNGACFQ